MALELGSHFQFPTGTFLSLFFCPIAVYCLLSKPHSKDISVGNFFIAACMQIEESIALNAEARIIRKI